MAFILFFAWNYRMPPSCCPARLGGTGLSASSVRLLLVSAALALAGCNATAPQALAAPTPPMTTAPVTPEPAESLPPPESKAADAPADEPPGTVQISAVLAQTDRIVRLAPADLAREIARLGEAEEALAENPLLLAVALAQTRQPVDTARALGLTQRVQGNPSAAAQALHPLARLMESRLVQQRRLEEQLERQTQQLREAQRRNDQLNERLEAVRAIERSLTTRPAPPAAAQASPPGSSPQRPAP